MLVCKALNEQIICIKWPKQPLVELHIELLTSFGSCAISCFTYSPLMWNSHIPSLLASSSVLEWIWPLVEWESVFWLPVCVLSLVLLLTLLAVLFLFPWKPLSTSPSSEIVAIVFDLCSASRPTVEQSPECAFLVCRASFAARSCALYSRAFRSAPVKFSVCAAMVGRETPSDNGRERPRASSISSRSS